MNLDKSFGVEQGFQWSMHYNTIDGETPNPISGW